jgi:hypothetical protein
MDPSYIDSDGFWLKSADTNGPESAPIANQEYRRFELRGRINRESNSGLELASVLL